MKLVALGLHPWVISSLSMLVYVGPSWFLLAPLGSVRGFMVIERPTWQQLHQQLHQQLQQQQQHQRFLFKSASASAVLHSSASDEEEPTASSSSTESITNSVLNKKKDNKAMAFLRKMGRVGGKAGFSGIGIDEGPAGKDTMKSLIKTKAAAAGGTNDQQEVRRSTKPKKDNKAMAFLRKVGKVGGKASSAFSGIGIDEGPAGKDSIHKPLLKTAKAAGVAAAASSFLIPSCAESGIIDDMTVAYPGLSGTGGTTAWGFFSDVVMGGVSQGSVERCLDYDGRPANVLRGSVRLDNNGGFIQMAADLSPPGTTAMTVVDASAFDGIEIDVQTQTTTTTTSTSTSPAAPPPIGSGSGVPFNVHLKTTACTRPFSSYRSEFQALPGTWSTQQLAWDSFVGNGPGASEVSLDCSQLLRVGVVAIGMERTVELAVSGLRFYKDKV